MFGSCVYTCRLHWPGKVCATVVAPVHSSHKVSIQKASVPLPPGTKGRGAYSPAGEGEGESQFRRLEKKLSTLPTLWLIPSHAIIQFFSRLFTLIFFSSIMIPCLLIPSLHLRWNLWRRDMLKRSKISNSRTFLDRICTLLISSGIDSSSLCSLAGRNNK